MAVCPDSGAGAFSGVECPPDSLDVLLEEESGGSPCGPFPGKLRERCCISGSPSQQEEKHWEQRPGRSPDSLRPCQDTERGKI